MGRPPSSKIVGEKRHEMFNPDCTCGIGLIVYRRDWFSKRRYGSKHCRAAFVDNAPKVQQKRNVTTYFEWLFATD
jgi:hypothetical protein